MRPSNTPGIQIWLLACLLLFLFPVCIRTQNLDASDPTNVISTATFNTSECATQNMTACRNRGKPVCMGSAYACALDASAMCYHEECIMPDNAKLCGLFEITFTYCPNGLTCISNSQCTDANNATSMALIKYRRHSYTFGIYWLSPLFISIISVYSLGLIILALVRRNHYPLKARSMFNVLGMIITVPISQGILLFPYSLPCSVYHLGMSIFTTSSASFIAFRMVHFFFMYTYYNSKVDSFQKADQVTLQKKMKLLKLLSSSVFFIVMIVIVCIVGLAMTFISMGIAKTSFFHSADSCVPLNLFVYLLLGCSGVLATICILCCALTIRIPDLFGIRLEFFLDVLINAALLISALPPTIISSQQKPIRETTSRFIFFIFGLIQLTNNGLLTSLRTFCWKKTISNATIEQNDLEQLLGNQRFIAVFKPYCKSELALENILFYEEVMRFKKTPTTNSQQLQTHADQIVRSFIDSATSFWELNISSTIRQQVMKKVNDPLLDTSAFDPALAECKMLLLDTFTRFQKTSQYATFKKSELLMTATTS